MSWHDTMHVTLAPERISYGVRSPLRRAANAAAVVDCVPAEGSPWQAACSTLAAVNAEGMARRPRLDVVVSDRLVRYQVLPWRPEVVSRAEWRAYALHNFVATYGEASRDWHIKIDLAAPGRPSLACAVDAGLIARLRDIAAGGTSRLVAVRPNFIHLFNRCRAAMRGSRFWFGVVEPNNIALGAFMDGAWRVMRNESVSAGWSAALPGMVRRSQFALAEPCDGMLYLCGDIDDTLPETFGGLKVRALASTPRPRARDVASARADG